jgi:hypothetical protein
MCARVYVCVCVCVFCRNDDRTHGIVHFFGVGASGETMFSLGMRETGITNVHPLYASRERHYEFLLSLDVGQLVDVYVRKRTAWYTATVTARPKFSVEFTLKSDATVVRLSRNDLQRCCAPAYSISRLKDP